MRRWLEDESLQRYPQIPDVASATRQLKSRIKTDRSRAHSDDQARWERLSKDEKLTELQRKYARMVYRDSVDDLRMLTHISLLPEIDEEQRILQLMQLDEGEEGLHGKFTKKADKEDIAKAKRLESTKKNRSMDKKGKKKHVRFSKGTSTGDEVVLLDEEEEEDSSD